ncbi:MAG TPA: hypothetical protein PKN50_17205 [Spirochaetota bacterium]|jgi:hypothetical protein|nr:hypothetical protein [Spirochaetota bacterium]HPV41220.1 hypothetical protein [Spirochaetota bacterium]
MTTDDIIAGMCLYGFIRKETPSEQTRCLNEIERHYGKSVARIVRNYMKNG